MVDPHNSPEPIEVKSPINGWAVLGFLYFFVAIGIVVSAALYFGEGKWMMATTLVAAAPLLYALKPLMKSDKKFAEQQWAHSFFVGMGFAFFLTIMLFFGVMIWAVTR